MNNQINKALKDTIISDEAIKIATDASEVMLDSILKDGLLKEVPIVGTIISLGKIVYSLKDRQTFKKIAIFLSRLSDIPIEDREKFVQKLDVEDKFKESISEKLLLLLERLDETSKAEIIGNLFKLYVLEIISKSQFMRFSNIVEKAFVEDLLALSSTSLYTSNANKSQTFSLWKHRQGLLLLGLFDQKIQKKQYSKEPELRTTINEFGSTLSNIMYYDLNNLDFLKYAYELKENKSLL